MNMAFSPDTRSVGLEMDKASFRTLRSMPSICEKDLFATPPPLQEGNSGSSTKSPPTCDESSSTPETPMGIPRKDGSVSPLENIKLYNMKEEAEEAANMRGSEVPSRSSSLPIQSDSSFFSSVPLYPLDMGSTSTTSAGSPPVGEELESPASMSSGLGHFGDQLSSISLHNTIADPLAVDFFPLNETNHRRIPTSATSTPTILATAQSHSEGGDSSSSTSEPGLSLSHCFMRAAKAAPITSIPSIEKMYHQGGGGTADAGRLQEMKSEDSTSTRTGKKSSFQSQPSYGHAETLEDIRRVSPRACRSQENRPHLCDDHVSTRWARGSSVDMNVNQQSPSNRFSSPRSPLGRVSSQEGSEGGMRPCVPFPFSADGCSSGRSWTNTTVASDPRQLSDAYAASEGNATNRLTDDGSRLMTTAEKITAARSTASAPATPPPLLKRVPSFGLAKKKSPKNSSDTMMKSHPSTTITTTTTVAPTGLLAQSSQSEGEVGRCPSDMWLPPYRQSHTMGLSSSSSANASQPSAVVLKRMKTAPPQELHQRRDQDSILTASQASAAVPGKSKLAWAFSLRGGLGSRTPHKFFRNIFKPHRPAGGGFSRSKSAPGLGRPREEDHDDEEDRLTEEEGDRDGGGRSSMMVGTGHKEEGHCRPPSGHHLKESSDEKKDEGGSCSKRKFRKQLSCGGGGERRTAGRTSILQWSNPFSSEPPRRITSAPATPEGGQKKHLFLPTPGGRRHPHHGRQERSVADSNGGGTGTTAISTERMDEGDGGDIGFLPDAMVIVEEDAGEENQLKKGSRESQDDNHRGSHSKDEGKGKDDVSSLSSRSLSLRHTKKDGLGNFPSMDQRPSSSSGSSLQETQQERYDGEGGSRTEGAATASRSPPTPPPPSTPRLLPRLQHMAQTDTNIEWRSIPSNVSEPVCPPHRGVLSEEHIVMSGATEGDDVPRHPTIAGQLLTCGITLPRGSFLLDSLQRVPSVVEDDRCSEGKLSYDGLRTEICRSRAPAIVVKTASAVREMFDKGEKALGVLAGDSAGRLLHHHHHDHTRDNGLKAVPEQQSGEAKQPPSDKDNNDPRTTENTNQVNTAAGNSTDSKGGGVVTPQTGAASSSSRKGGTVRRGKTEKFSRQTMHRLVMKQFKVTNLTASDMRLVIRYKSLYLDDIKGLLEIARLPAYAGHVHTAPTTDKNSWLNRPRWSARYFVLRYGHWFWFRDEKALLTGGLSACLGSISLLLNPFTIDLHPKYTTRFFIRFGDWYSVQIDTSIERKDRGEWALLFLASGNLGEQIRMCFTDIDWTQVQTRSRLVAKQNLLVP
ncbi:transmembrane protein [Cystoisospora suis]|uniref:Transmembrane protein n=1 Tax=Cystoisospora suis TaxID=483139 RepID=A0A2C6LBL0_9APIC|nr:transmembrane protein [Cystoisospora suis]